MDAMTESSTPNAGLMQQMPEWARKLILLYESNSSNQFILHGNVGDRMVLPLEKGAQLGSLEDFLLRVLMPRFDIILTYDLGNGLRVEKGGEKFGQWPPAREGAPLPTAPNGAIETLTRYFRYSGNLARLGKQHLQIGCILRAADLIVPGLPGGLSYELNALALQIRDWSTETIQIEQPLATFLITENLNDLHPHLASNSRAAQIQIPLPGTEELERAFSVMAPSYPKALGSDPARLQTVARQLVGAKLASIEGLLKTTEHEGRPLADEDLVSLKKQLVENDCNGLIEFIESGQTLEDFAGQEKIKTWMRQDIELWRQNDVEALPMGYLICGPVGTGKTYLVKCLAGQAGVPVVKLKNFRDKWVGSSEGNLEKIFRLLHALGRCFVFIDEADQALGRRDSGSGDSGVSGRLYSMMAEEMSNTRNRGKIIWILASSRPDLIEVDLKRPGRVDVKIPIFPTVTPEDGFGLIRILCKRRGVALEESLFEELKTKIPNLLTPGAAEALAVKIYRLVRTSGQTPAQALRDCLADYQNPVPAEVMEAQIRLAVREASDLDFVPSALRSYNQ